MRRSIMQRVAALVLFSQGGTVHSYIGTNHRQRSVPSSEPQLVEEIGEHRLPRYDFRTRVQFDEESASLAISPAFLPSPGAASPIEGCVSESAKAMPPTAVAVPQTTITLSPLEAWFLTYLDRWYHQSQAVKCPFLRRRYGDLLDNLESLMKHTVIRRQCWSLMGPPQAWRPAGVNKKLQRIKYKGLTLEELRTLVWHDWKPETGKGYYVTGKLTTACYRDDCLFSGPDPDMPIQGLRKYVGVAAHLFDVDQSRATLKSLKVVDDNLVAEWQLRGILRLPWRPQLPTFDGTTVYHIDDKGLIARHEEFWNISVVHAFSFTLFPDLAKRIWKGGDGVD